MKNILVLLALIVAGFGISKSYAAADKDAPVMVIRFNQEFVDYKKSLEKVAASAISAKADVLFDIVSVVPELSSKQENEKMQLLATSIADRAADTLRESGAKDEQIRVTYQKSAATASSELHIFLR